MYSKTKSKKRTANEREYVMWYIFNQFLTNVPILPPMQTPKNHRISGGMKGEYWPETDYAFRKMFFLRVLVISQVKSVAVRQSTISQNQSS